MPNGWVLNQARCLPLNWFSPMTKIALLQENDRQNDGVQF
jgi:hypothetical protein